METKIEKMIYWAPRILGIVFVLFLTSFSLDVFEPNKTAKEIAVGLLMHNIPALVLAGLLAAAWKREIVGAIAFALAGLAYVGFMAKSVFEHGFGGFEWRIIAFSFIIAGPAFLLGGLFWAGWRRRQSKPK